MGQKINPIGLRLGINRTWDSRWFAGKQEYGKLLHEDVKIREILHKELKQAAVARIVIERPHKKCRVTIHSARPGVVIGKKGADIDKLRKKVADITSSDVVINIVEIRKPELDATLVAESIAQQLERRVAFRRAMKRAVQSAMRLGAGGIRINCSGRLGGAEIARMEWYREGRVPLHTLRADVDYGVATAFHDLRHLRRQGLDLQGRDPRARSDGPGQEDGRRRQHAAFAPRRRLRQSRNLRA
ncbi:small subunit ribosomal protein S3 [Bradyrhizobium sp. USDA 4518]